MFIALFIAAPLLVLPFYPNELTQAPAFAVPALIIAAIGFAMACLSREKSEAAPYEWQSPLQKGSLPVLFVWCVAIVCGAIPFVASGLLSPLYALFESVSGWSTTGLTVIDIERLPHIFLFHRALMQFGGGLGFIIIIGIVMQGRQMMSIYNAEGHPSGLMPNLRRTSLAIFLVYISALILGTVLYVLFGMTPFDAICHTMSAISTAGFTTRVSGIAAYNSVAIECVTVLLMLIGSTNFAVLLLLARGKLRRVAKISEVRFALAITAIFIPLITFSLAFHGDFEIFDALRHAVFGVVSASSTTGYATVDFGLWPSFAAGLLVPLAIVGGASGSTAGGIKLQRVYIFARVTKNNISRRLSPARRVRVMRYHRTQGYSIIDNSLILDTMEFVACYIAIIAVGTLLLTLTEGCALTDALFEFSSVFVTVGVSNGLTARASAPGLVIEMFGMLLGRLEIFIVFIGMYSAFDKVRDHITHRSTAR